MMTFLMVNHVGITRGCGTAKDRRVRKKNLPYRFKQRRHSVSKPRSMHRSSDDFLVLQTPVTLREGCLMGVRSSSAI